MSNIAWCPTIPSTDKEVKEACSTVKYLPGNPQVFYGSSSGSLNVLNPDDTLYIVSHGHSALPVFNVGESKWTPSQLANLLMLAGLKKTHHQIVMLVCHAGQSVGTKQQVNDRWSINAAARNPLSDMVARKQAVDRALKAFKQASPQEFTSEDQTLPMICQFIDELKNRKFNNIRVRGFLGKVSTDFKNGIYVQNPNSNAWLKASKSNTVDWL